MTSFICDRCGKCCVSLGQSVTVERQLNDRDYYCRSRIDNAIFLAYVDPAYREEIADEYVAEGGLPPGAEKRPCPFLRKDPSGIGTSCAIYETRPNICRDFRCYRMLIRDREGTICGRVIGKNTVRTDDPALEKLWLDQVMQIPAGDTAAWTKQVKAVLAADGYRAEIVE